MADVSVGAAAPGDASEVTRVQAAAWRMAYADVLPSQLLATLDSASVTRVWLDAIMAPPTPRHRLLVAREGPEVVGFAALGPASDLDLAGKHDAEFFDLCVDPDHAGAGHGSRLLNAAVDQLRDDGFRKAHAWVPGHAEKQDDPLRAFLEASGWGASGAQRSLDLAGDGARVFVQVRLHTSIERAG